MLKKILNISLTVLLLWASACAYSQNSYRFRTFSPRGGFYYDGVQSIIQDNEGFIWALLENDLQRFDGYEFKRYSSYFQNLPIKNTWSFGRLAKDVSGNYFYISTNNGLFKYDKYSDSFNKVIDGHFGNVITIDDNDNIWCNYEKAFYWIEKISHSIEPVLYNGVEINGVTSCVSNSKGVLFSSYNKVYYSDYKNTKKAILFYDFPSDHNIVEVKKEGESVWVLTRKHGLYKVNMSTRKIEKQLQLKDKNDNAPIKTFHVDRNGDVWVGTQKGLYVLDADTGKQQLYLYSKQDVFSLPNNSVWTITSDTYNNIWVGTFAGGLCYVNLDEELNFKTYNHLENSLDHNLVSSFAKDGKFLWIGTEGGGLNRLDTETGSFTYYKHTDKSNSLSYNNVKSLQIDAQKNLWIAMYRGGLDYFDTKTKSFQHFRSTSQDKESLYVNDLRKIVLEQDSGLWVAYQVNRSLVSYLSFKSGKFTHYSFDENAYIFDMQKDSIGNLWIISHNRLYKMDVKRREIKAIPLKGIDILNAQSLCVDANNDIWIGTIGQGLVKYDVATSIFTPFRDILHFNISAIYSMCLDIQDCLWLGTDNGLFRYDKKNNSYQRFDEADGFQGQVYYPLAAMAGDGGELYFGGTNGFTIVDPLSINKNMHSTKAAISDFFINNSSTKQNIGQALPDSRIVLNYKQTNFGFRFSSDNYLSPGKNLFKYRLKGYDNNWITTDAFNRVVMYSKIPPGAYYFEVQAANNDGVWGDTILSLKIVRKSAPWVAWYAWLMYSIVILAVFAVFLYYFNERRKLKLQLYIDGLEKQKNNELHQAQLQFFTNISHDFRTPLSLILAAVDSLKQEGVKEYYYRILRNNSQRLLNLVNELMDFRTVENKKMQLRLEPIDVNLLVKELSEDFKDLAKKRDITLNIFCDPNISQNLHADKQIMEKVIMNLLNNAFKYTDDGGRITVETYSDFKSYIPRYEHGYELPDNRTFENGFLFVVRDTGVGITKNSLSSVFDRFYKVDTLNLKRHLGTGIGLALVKSLVLLHKGAISIFSEREKGTDIAVYLPTDSSMYDKSDYIQSKKDTEQSELLSVNSIDSLNIIMEDFSDKLKNRILIVEDNNDLRILLSDFLSPHYEVVQASNGVEASEILEKENVSLILSDIMMPLKDGVTFCREVKENVNTSHIPFILLTAKTDLESKIDSASSGADLYFEKPIDFSLLLLSIQNVFKAKQNLREYCAKNFWADTKELSKNKIDNDFLEELVQIIDVNLNQPNIDVNYIASELSMSRSKLYSKVKMLTGKSIVEFTLDYKLKKAARLLIEEDSSINQIMERVGIRSMSYFSSIFKKEFGETPSAFAAKYKK